MTNIFVRLKQTRLRNRVLAAVLACAVVLSAAAAVTIPLINAPKAVGEKPGTTAYYNARGEDAKTQVGKVTVSTTDTDYQSSDEGNYGSFVIKKSLDMPTEMDEVFYFRVEYRGNGDEAGDVQDTMYVRVEIPADEQWAEASFTAMRSGWYTVTEMNTNWKYELDGDLAERNPEADVEGSSVTQWIE